MVKVTERSKVHHKKLETDYIYGVLRKSQHYVFDADALKVETFDTCRLSVSAEETLISASMG